MLNYKFTKQDLYGFWFHITQKIWTKFQYGNKKVGIITLSTIAWKEYYMIIDNKMLKVSCLI